jgi:hypothetical protein
MDLALVLKPNGVQGPVNVWVVPCQPRFTKDDIESGKRSQVKVECFAVSVCNEGKADSRAAKGSRPIRKFEAQGGALLRYPSLVCNKLLTNKVASCPAVHKNFDRDFTERGGKVEQILSSGDGEARNGDARRFHIQFALGTPR